MQPACLSVDSIDRYSDLTGLHESLGHPGITQNFCVLFVNLLSCVRIVLFSFFQLAGLLYLPEVIAN